MDLLVQLLFSYLCIRYHHSIPIYSLKKNVDVIINIMIMGKIIKVPLRINMMNLHSPTSSLSSIIPFSFNSCNLRTIIIILFDLIQGNGAPHLLSKDFASCFANMTNETQTTRKISRTIKIIIFLRLYILQLPNPWMGYPCSASKKNLRTHWISIVWNKINKFYLKFFIHCGINSIKFLFILWLI